DRPNDPAVGSAALRNAPASIDPRGRKSTVIALPIGKASTNRGIQLMSNTGRRTEDPGPASTGMHRRSFLHGTAAFAAASAGAMTLGPRTADAQSASPSATTTGGELIIRGGHVLSMD